LSLDRRGRLVLLKRIGKEIRLWRRRLALLLFLKPAEKHVEQAFGEHLAWRKKCAGKEKGGHGQLATPLIGQLCTQRSPHPTPGP
jgi:hypothetical protein